MVTISQCIVGGVVATEGIADSRTQNSTKILLGRITHLGYLFLGENQEAGIFLFLLRYHNVCDTYQNTILIFESVHKI